MQKNNPNIEKYKPIETVYNKMEKIAEHNKDLARKIQATDSPG